MQNIMNVAKIPGSHELMFSGVKIGPEFSVLRKQAAAGRLG
jgi:hypothetical protein